ncbi:hypothetical protein BJF83_23880 [Nocardiopsis sp. CNR-923]|nr:hypothetical protein BJF83_23880 [Nocardiopsis sp. CNR-923]
MAPLWTRLAGEETSAWLCVAPVESVCWGWVSMRPRAVGVVEGIVPVGEGVSHECSMAGLPAAGGFYTLGGGVNAKG